MMMLIIIIIISCIGFVPINFDMDILRADTVQGSYSTTSQWNLPSCDVNDLHLGPLNYLCSSVCISVYML